jgi:DNA-binding LacI/PurR family transcriptional regulator
LLLQEYGMSRNLTLEKVDHDDPTPKYLQTREILIGAIRSGVLTPGAKLPSTKEIGALVDISLITAHKALEGLVEAGWLRREVGRGTYVRDDVDPANGVQTPLYIALILDPNVNIDDYYHGTILNGLRQVARADTRRIEFFFQDRLDLRDKGAKAVGALCIHPPIEQQPQVEQLSRQHPVVVLGGAFPNGSVVAVDCDNDSGARDAVRHLVELGHRRVMILSGPMSLTNSRDRRDGALAELAEHGIHPAEDDLPVSADSVVLDEATKAHLERRLAGPDRPTAIVAGGFYLALAAMQAAREVGLAIPRDLSIVGFDDPASAPMLDPPLTTVRQPLVDMAASAYKLIRKLVTDRKASASSRSLPTELVVRGSSGPAPRC